jgi:hypothetical protein
MRSTSAISPTKSHPQVILQAKRSPAFLSATTRRSRTDYWPDGLVKRKRLIDGTTTPLPIESMELVLVQDRPTPTISWRLNNNCLEFKT